MLAVLIGTAVLAALTGSGGGSGPGPRATPGPVVLIGTAGLRWQDVDSDTPILAALRDRVAVAALVPSVGGRGGDVAAGWAAATAGPASAAARAGLRTAAVGPNAVAALGGTGATFPGAPARPDGTIDPAAGDAELDEQVRAALADRPDLLLVDLGTVAVRSDGSPAEDQVRAVDSRLGTVLGAVPTDGSALVVSVASPGPDLRMQLLAGLGPGPSAPGGAATRFADDVLRPLDGGRPGMARMVDVPATLTALLGLPAPAASDGAALVPAGTGDSDLVRAQHLEDLDAAAAAAASHTGPLLVSLAVGVGLLAAAGAAALRWRPAGDRVRSGAVTGVSWAAVALAVAPAATFLANLWPWWRTEPTGAVLTAAVLAFTLPLAAAALLGPWRRSPWGPAGAAGALTALVVAGDALAGSPLSVSSPLGHHPLTGDPVTGSSPAALGLLAAGGVLAAAATAARAVRQGRLDLAALAVAAVGVPVVAVTVRAAPDGGGTVAVPGPAAGAVLAVAFAVVVLEVTGGLSSRLVPPPPGPWAAVPVLLVAVLLVVLVGEPSWAGWPAGVLATAVPLLLSGTLRAREEAAVAAAGPRPWRPPRRR